MPKFFESDDFNNEIPNDPENGGETGAEAGRESETAEPWTEEAPLRAEDDFPAEGFIPQELGMDRGEDFNIEDYTRMVNFSGEDFPAEEDPGENTGEYTPGSGGKSGMSKRERRRRKRAARPLWMKILLIAVKFLVYNAVALLAGYIIANVGWKWANDVLSLQKEPVTATVELGDELFTPGQETDEEGTVTDVLYADMDAIALILQEQGLIEYPWLFEFYAKFSNKDTALLPGTYDLNTEMDYSALLRNMGPRSATRTVVKVTIPEGYTMEEIFQILETSKVCSAEELMDAAANYDFDYFFLDDSTLGDPKRLEGYLFPDTYEFYQNSDPETAINKFLSNFNGKFSEEFRLQAETMGYSVQEILIVASIIEKETDGTDRSNIASVIYNRINYPSLGTLGYLQMDSTVQYALGERKDTLSYEDLEVDSPYNTYLHTGLPVGPISNPGLKSIEAALYPENTDYFYFVLGDDGKHHFFENHADFLEFKESQTGIIDTGADDEIYEG